MISSDQINDIRNKVNIVDIVSNYITLTKKGKNYFGTCPFHPDNDPSFCVSEQKQIYTCFSCKASGNVFQFVMNYENVSFREAIKMVADNEGIPLDINVSHESFVNKNSSLYEIYEIACKFYQNNINTVAGEKALDYLKERGFDDNIIDEFMIGLSLKKNDLLTKLLVNKKFSYDDMLKSALIVQHNDMYNDIYSNRIMFPIWDTNGRVVGFSGRIFNGEDTSVYSKYINSRETPIFKKGDLLYNYHRAKQSCRQKNSVVIVEGQLDLIRIYSVGITNIIATMGTAVTREHASLIKRIAKRAIICFDGDGAGEKATLSCGNELTRVGVDIGIVRLEDNLDPDEYIRKYGKERFESKLENPISFMDFKLSYFKKNLDLNNNQDVAKYVNTIIQELTLVDDEVLRELTLKKLSIESNLDIDFLRNNLEKKSDKKVENKPVKKESVIKKDKYEIAIKNLLYYMLRDKNVIKMYNDSRIFIADEKYRILAKEISGFYLNNGFINIADIMNSFITDVDMTNLIGEIGALDLKENYNVNEIEDYINVIKQYNVNNEKNKINSQLHQSSDQLEKLQLAQKLFEMKQDQIKKRS